MLTPEYRCEHPEDAPPVVPPEGEPAELEEPTPPDADEPPAS